MSRVVAICGGGGKSTLTTKYPTQFLDIDAHVWSERNSKWHSAIVSAVERNDQSALGSIYRQCLTENAEQLRDCGKVLLVHHPDNAAWLDATLLGTMRPVQILHARNIAKRSRPLLVTAIESWKNLEDAPGLWEYSSHDELEKHILSLVETTGGD
jgi:hypothetical protein